MTSSVNILQSMIGQYASSPGYRAYCYAGLAFYPAVAITTARTDFTYPETDDQAELAWMDVKHCDGWIPANGHPSQY